MNYYPFSGNRAEDNTIRLLDLQADLDRRATKRSVRRDKNAYYHTMSALNVNRLYKRLRPYIVTLV